MPRLATPPAELRTFRNDDLLLHVAPPPAPALSDRYEAFLDALCGRREYQKEAIRVALAYLTGGHYANLRALAEENFARRLILAERYGTWERLDARLQLPDQRAASLDLATGTGKSYVLYGLAAILLAEGIIDNALVLCPSTTIETGLLTKFRDLASRADLRDLLPTDAKIATPGIINASESIVTGSLCVENYHAVLEHVGSSIRESLWGKGERTLILNDEAHHVATEPAASRKWKEFLTDSAYGFRYLIGVSGTCYVKNDYFADVIYRYSLRQAMEDNIVKSVHYVAEMPQTNAPDEKWQLIRNRHEAIRETLTSHGIRPLTIIVTESIQSCKNVTERLKGVLSDLENTTPEETQRRVLSVYSNAPDLRRLRAVDDPTSEVEWIVSVSMLNEGWDVKRVFQIVPYEKRAFESKLLIAQVLGRGLRIPEGWSGPQPEVTIFNHDAWAGSIKHLVDEVLEIENRLSSSVRLDSPLHFDLHNIDYTREPTGSKKQMTGPYTLFKDGYVDLAARSVHEDVSVEFADAATGRRYTWGTQIHHQSYTPQEIARVMYERLEHAYLPGDPDPQRHYRYADDFPLERLEEIVRKSLQRRGVEAATEDMKQKFLSALGTLNRGASEYVRYTPKPANFYIISTRQRQSNSVSQAELRRDKTYIYTDGTREKLAEEQWPCFDEVTEEGSGFKVVYESDLARFKTPLNAAIAEYDPELRFIRLLRDPNSISHYDAWIKSTTNGFYKIDYYWRKGEHPKSGEFNPDFFIKVSDKILVVEIKDDSEISEPSPENFKKNEYAQAHFICLNQQLEETSLSTRYQFNFLTPGNFNTYFQYLREGRIEFFRSDLDVILAKDE